MMQKPYEIQLELYRKDMRNTAVNYIVADAETMPLHISLLKNHLPAAIPAGAAVELHFQTASGVQFPRFATVVNHELGKVLYEIHPSDIAVAGPMQASVSVTDGPARLTWQGFQLTVTRSQADDEHVPPDMLLPWQMSIVAQLTDHENRINFLEQFGGGGGDVGFVIDHETLKLTGNVLSVNTTNDALLDNTRPITSAGVFTIVGNIEVLLEQI